jgi:hypothetical protein
MPALALLLPFQLHNIKVLKAIKVHKIATLTSFGVGAVMQGTKGPFHT